MPASADVMVAKPINGMLMSGLPAYAAACWRYCTGAIGFLRKPGLYYSGALWRRLYRVNQAGGVRLRVGVAAAC